MRFKIGDRVKIARADGAGAEPYVGMEGTVDAYTFEYLPFV